MSSDHSSLSEKSRHLLDNSCTRGSHKIKYQPESDWDFHVDAGDLPVDLSLMLPHYRARHQPLDHRMSMCVAGHNEPIKVKVCRTVPRSKFYLEVLSADSSDITIWLPSDFRGQIHHSGKATYSAGFINRILQNVRINEPLLPSQAFYNNTTPGEDDVVVITRGHITFRMWDVERRGPENAHKEGLKRMFGMGSCLPAFVPGRRRKTPEAAGIDWDCLLRDQ